jgi:tetratricopeptide (TPR) repeat protein
MGSRLALLAAVQLIAAAALTREAAADRASDLYKRGINEYKAQKYEQAAATLKEAYELDPKPDSLFALAQAERLAERCPEARVHYKKLLAETTDPAVLKAVQSNLDLCGPDPDKPAEPKQVEADRPAPEPKVITKTNTVVREVRRTDKLATLLFAGGTLGLGAGGGLYLASMNSRDDAKRAGTLDDHEKLSDRADLQRIAAIAAGGAGVLMIGVAVVRWATSGSSTSTEPKTQVTLAPSSSGALLMLSSGW